MRLTLLCHAATAATRAGRFPLDDAVEPSALPALATSACRVPPHDRCLMSPARRARETAAALGLTGAIEPSLRDQDFGCWAGMTLDAVQAENPCAVAAWLADPAAAPHGGESVLAVVARVGAWLGQQGRDGDRHVLAVTHASVIRAAVAAVFEASAAFWRVDIPPLAVARFSGTGTRWTLRGLGDLAGRR